MNFSAFSVVRNCDTPAFLCMQFILFGIATPIVFSVLLVVRNRDPRAFFCIFSYSVQRHPCLFQYFHWVGIMTPVDFLNFQFEIATPIPFCPFNLIGMATPMSFCAVYSVQNRDPHAFFLNFSCSESRPPCLFRECILFGIATPMPFWAN